ncbi:MAG: hypothetical protein M4D80_42475 [Myxococcota bacterium]|nr:hypothetical protein [Myxococcota bacterium]
MTFRILLIASLLAACGDTSSSPPLQLNLDRPVDVAFACYGGLRITGGGGNDEATPQQDIVFSAQPQRACEIRSNVRGAGEPVMTPPGQQDLTGQGGAIVPGAAWYGLILQQGPGTVAVAQFATKAAIAFSGGSDVVVLDADPLTPGKNSISVGEDPISIVTDTIGCSAVTANAGSCDLSVLDLTTALDLDGRVNISRLEVTNISGTPIRSKPAAMVTEPKDEAIGNYCPSRAPGAPSPVIAQGLAYIAYPSCHLVAGVDLATGRMVTGVRLSDTGAPELLDTPAELDIVCPDECGVGGAPATVGPRPVTLDLEYDAETSSGVQTRRLVIGSENRNSILVVELDAASRPLSVSPVLLEGPTTLGVTSLALSEVIGVGGASGMVDDLNGRIDYQYVYAVATDQTVRVIEVLENLAECDTQVDPRFLRSGQDAATLGCLVVGDIATPARRAGARGPGIDVGKDQIPASVDITRAEAVPGDQRPPGIPSKLVGHYAVISTLAGEAYVVTIDDDDYPDAFESSTPLSVPVALVIPHQIRDGIPFRSELAVVDNGAIECDNSGPILTNGAVEGGPRAPTLPSRSLFGFIAPEKGLQLPGLRALKCEGVDSTKIISEFGFPAPELQRDLAFPDWRALATDEQWALTWEGSLSSDRADTATDGPVIRESMLYVDQAGMHLRDQTKPFCDAGVEPFDIVQMRGCDPSLASLDCPIGYQCYIHPQSQVQGIGACILKDEAERLAEACRDFLTSIRRYTVVRAETGELLLTTRRHEQRLTPLDGCINDDQCELLGDLGKRSSLSTHPSDPIEQNTVDDRQWVCRADPTRPPRGTNNKRCNMACDETTQCAAGTVCVGGNTATDVRDGYCMEGVVPPQACVNAPQRYELRAAEAFVVAGSRTGYVHPIIADATKTCVKDPAAHPLLTSRIGLDPPPCATDSDPFTGKKPDGTYEPNPCATSVTHAENLPRYIPGTCTLDEPNQEIRERTAPAIRYRNRGLTFNVVDPFYPGDQTCIQDRLGPNGVPLVRVPQVFHGYATSFRQQGGFVPLRIPISPVFPVKVLRGPLQSIWVVDEGDFLSTSLAQPSTRGKVFRIEPHGLGLINTLE